MAGPPETELEMQTGSSSRVTAGDDAAPPDATRPRRARLGADAAVVIQCYRVLRRVLLWSIRRGPGVSWACSEKGGVKSSRV